MLAEPATESPDGLGNAFNANPDNADTQNYMGVIYMDRVCTWTGSIGGKRTAGEPKHTGTAEEASNK